MVSLKASQVNKKARKLMVGKWKEGGKREWEKREEGKLVRMEKK